MDKQVKKYAEEYKKANNTVLEYIEENKRLENVIQRNLQN